VPWVSDPITDQEMAFARLILSGTMNDRRLSSSAGTQPAAPPVQAQIHNSEWRREQQHQPVGEEPGDPVADTKTPLAAPQVPEPELHPSQPGNWLTTRRLPTLTGPNPALPIPFLNPESLNRVPVATDGAFDAVLDKASSLRPSLFPR
jgi:hypothetical protein